MIPTEDECLKLLDELNPKLKLHSVFVKDLALDVAEKLMKKGVKVNRDLLIAGALLHDITKSGSGDKHNITGAELILEKGFFPEVANIVRNHIFNTKPCSVEEKIVFYVDKLANPGQVKVSVEERLKYVFDKYDVETENYEAWLNQFKDIEKDLFDNE